MCRFLTFIFVLFCFNTSAAKVAYIPVTTHQIFHPESKKIMVLDLETGLVLKNIYSPSGHFSGSVFLNNSSTTLYAASGMQVTVIDTSLLKVVNTINTPSVVADLFLNMNNDKLYYISTDSAKLYAIDLTTQNLALALDFDQERISNHWINESLNTVVFLTSTSSGISNFRVYDLNNMTEKFSATPITFNIELISNDGLDYFYTNHNAKTFYSRKLSDNSINWIIDVTDENNFPILSDNENGSITAIGKNNAYVIDRASGQESLISSQGTQGLSALFGYNFGEIKNNSFLVVNYPVIFCLTGWCSLSSELDVSILNVNDSSHTIIYNSSQIGGSTVKGRFIGEKHYTIPIIPIINTPILIMLLLLLIVVLTYNSKRLTSF